MEKIKIPNSIKIIALALFFSSCTRIDAGYVGLVVNLYGSDRGVQDVTEVSGMVWYNPMTTSIHKFPIFVQNVVFTKDANEGSPANEEFRLTTQDGLTVSFDVSMSYRVDPEKVTEIFIKYRKDLEELDKTMMRNYMRNVYNQLSGKYSAEQLYENKTRFQTEAEAGIKKALEVEGFIVEQVVFLNDLRLPQAVVDNINAKINARQIALKKEQEVAQERAEAQKEIERAKGYAESVRIKSEAEANANKIVAESISQSLIQYEKVKKWDGKNPHIVTGNGGTSVLLNGND